MFTKKNFFVLLLNLYLPGLAIPSAADQLPLQLIKLPPGFKIELYAENIPNARAMTLSPEGTVFVGTRTAGKVFALLDTNKDYKVDQVYQVADGLWGPNGVAYREGALYVSTVNRILRFDNIHEQMKNSDQKPSFVVVNSNFPSDTWHGWKFIAFGPDGYLYVPVGAPCNVCEKDDLRFGSIMRMKPDGSDLQIFAKGIRNTVGFTWHPETKEMWFTDNGRDMLGDDLPPDELNRAPRAGLHFGFPYCHGRNILDPEFGNGKDCKNYRPPVVELGPHVASLGLRFYTGGSFPKQFHHQIFIAEHGSWNRSTKIGYRITMVELENNRPKSYKVFAQGWKVGEQVWGRPVDLLNMPDGSLLVSDDFANAVYRITYNK